MSFVICFGVNRGVQMVFRYPAKGVGLDLYSRPIPDTDDLKTTLGVRTDHLSFLLCPQQIGMTPESDEITVETFSFHVRYFHVQSGPIRHLAIVCALQNSAAADQARETSAFLDAYSLAVVREQNRCNYLQQAIEYLSKTRDRAEEKGNWSTILSGNVENASPLVKELIAITDVLRQGGRIQLHVNGWLYLVSKTDINLSRNRKAGFCAEQLLGNAQNTDGGYRSKQTVDSYTYLMVHPELPQPLGARIAEAADILKDVSLPQCLSFLATPCSIADFREQIRRRMLRANAPPTAPQPSWHGAQHTARPSLQPVSATASPLGSAASTPALKHSTFNRLLDWLISNGIARVLKTYYVFQPHVFVAYSMSFADAKSSRKSRSHRARDAGDGARSARTELQASQSEGALRLPNAFGAMETPSEEDRGGGIGATYLVGSGTASPDSRSSPAASPMCLRRYIEQHITFLEMIARVNNSRWRGGVKAVDIIENLRQLIDYFDGMTPKEEILSRVPSVPPEALDEVVFVFHEFITTIIA